MTLGIDPDLCVRFASITFDEVVEREKLLKDTIEPKPVSNLAKSLYPSFTLREILFWAHEHGIQVYAPLKQAYDSMEKVRSEGGSLNNPYRPDADITKDSIESTEPTEKSKNAYENLILAMAVNAYGFGKEGSSVHATATILEGVVDRPHGNEGSKSNMNGPKANAITNYLNGALQRHPHLGPPKHQK